MGSAKPDDYRRDSVAAAMVDEGVAALRSPDHPVMATIAVAEMARRVGVTERTGYAQWDAEDLHVAVIRRSLGLEGEGDDQLTGAELVDVARDMIDDDTLPPSQVVAAIFNFAWRSLVDDPGRRAVYALWPYCDGNSRLSKEIRACLNEYYASWFKTLLSIIDSYVAKHSRKITIRDEISRDDMARMAILFAEGAAFHARLGESIDNPGFHAELPGVLVQLIMSYAIEFHDDEGDGHPFDKRLARLDPEPNPDVDLSTAAVPSPPTDSAAR
jgi:hypothetical protein